MQEPHVDAVNKGQKQLKLIVPRSAVKPRMVIPPLETQTVVEAPDLNEAKLKVLEMIDQGMTYQEIARVPFKVGDLLRYFLPSLIARYKRERDGIISPPKSEVKVSKVPVQDAKVVVQEASVVDAYRMLEQGNSPTDIMIDKKLSPSDMLTILKTFNEIRLENVRRQNIDNRYTGVWLEIGRALGMTIRDGCPHYADEAGVCDYWDFKEMDPDLRSKFPGVFSIVSNMTKAKVLHHPEVCALCQRANIFKTAGVQAS